MTAARSPARHAWAARALLVLVTSVLGGASAEALGADGSGRREPMPERGAANARGAGSPLAELERAVRELEREELALRTRLDDLGQRSEQARERALWRGRAYVRKARAGLLPIGEGFAAFVEHAASLERFRRAIDKDQKEERALVTERARVAQRLDEVTKRLGPLRADHDALLRAEHALLAVEDRQRAFERAFVSATPGDHLAVYGAVGPADSTDRTGFAGMKGRLPFPIAGRSEIRTARRSSSEGPGLELRAPVGTTVRSVYRGRVAFADDYADYGKTVILEHGDRHYTVTGNLDSIDVRVGEEISANTRIGGVGDSERGALVYFEVRVGTTTVDPAEWFGL